MATLTTAERIEGGLLGLLVGDALGVPYEFHHPSSIPDRRLIDMAPPPGFNRAHMGIEPGTWSDDGAQALCLATSLLDKQHLHLDDFARRMVDWLDHGYMAVDGLVFDCGRGTRTALARFKAGDEAAVAGGENSWDNGNGALMRVLPLALWHRGDDSTLIAAAQLQACPTHRHAVAQVCCALYCVVARLMFFGALGDAATWDKAAGILRRHYAGNTVLCDAFDAVLRSPHRSSPSGSGYIVDQIWSCRWALQATTYEDVVKDAISLGRDTDTSACIAGGLAGVRDGVRGIPERWRDALRGRELLNPVLQGLLARERDLPMIEPATESASPTLSAADDTPRRGFWRRLFCRI